MIDKPKTFFQFINVAKFSGEYLLNKNHDLQI